MWADGGPQTDGLPFGNVVALSLEQVGWDAPSISDLPSVGRPLQQHANLMQSV